MHKPLAIALVSVTLCACGPFITEKDYFNYREFDGRSVSNGDITLDTELTSPLQGKVKVKSCKQAKSINKAAFSGSEYLRYQKMMADCHAAEQYVSGRSAKQNYFQGMSLAEILQKMPAISVPQLDELSFNKRHGKTLQDYESSLDLDEVSENSISTTLANRFKVKYILMARRDVNQDGIEDVIIRLQWKTDSAVLDNTALIALTKYATNDPIKILWRYQQ
jgi:hypothetical protein